MDPLRLRPRLEVCVDSAEGAHAAEFGGADRVELCCAPSEGGLTPSLGALECARARVRLGLVVLVRPRPGDFSYSALELEAMKRDVRAAREAGADGVAIGCLSPDGRVDRERTGELAELARPLSVTFHRAFDMSRDPLEALSDLMELGIERVLSSGGEASALAGIDLLARLVREAAGRIAVVPAGGVAPENAARVLRESGARELHFTAAASEPSAMLHRNPRSRMGSGRTTGEYELRRTQSERVRRIREAADAAGGFAGGGS